MEQSLSNPRVELSISLWNVNPANFLAARMVVHVTHTVLGLRAVCSVNRVTRSDYCGKFLERRMQFTPQRLCSVLRKIYDARSKSDRNLVLLLLCSTQRAEEAHLDYFMAEQRKVIPLSDGC